MTSLVVPGLDTLRQWLDDLGMSFFECDNCQALHLPHMQGNDSNLLIVFYVQIMPDDFVMQLHRF